MDEGAIIEEGRPDAVLTQPKHPQAREFLARVLTRDTSVQREEPELAVSKGENYE
jgi:ABC-type dipeptide/oligopeptide/nickel transport system ATPase component